MSRLRKLASETAIYGLSSILGRVLNFLLVPLYTHVLTRADNGVLTLVYGAFVFLNILFSHGMESAYLKFAAGDEGRARQRTVFTTATVSLLSASFLLGGLFLLVPSTLAWIAGLEGAAGVVPGRIVALAVAILVLDALAVVPFAELRLAGRAKAFALARFAGILVNIGMTVWLLVGLDRGVTAVFEANVVASAITLVLLLPVYADVVRRNGEGGAVRVDRGLWRELLAFGLPFIPGGLGYAVTERASLFGLEKLRAGGLAEAGLFGQSWKLGVFMMLVVQMFRFAWQPFFLQHARDTDAKPLFARVFTVVHAILVAVLLGVSFFAFEVATLPLPGGRTLIAETFLPGLVVVPLSLLAYLLQGWYYVFSAGLYIEKQTRYFVHATGAGSVAAVVATVLLVPRMGIVGAGWANVAGYGVMAFVLLWRAQRTYPIPFDWRRVGLTSAIGGALFALWSGVEAARAWPVEAGLLLLYVAALVAIGVIPPVLLARLRRRPQRPVPVPDVPAESAASGRQMADLAADPASMAAEDEGEPDTAAPPPARS